jgi:indolepyruvate ferredoxin oxidoreductase beta subunit
MKVDIILAGVGGQGILSIAAIIGSAAIEKGLYLKQAETHGMSQRGGAVISHLRIADYPIASDLIPEGKADVIISVEPMESLRYLNYLSQTGCVVTNTAEFVNIPDYPSLDELMIELGKLPKSIVVDAEKIAKEAGNIKASNMAILGAASPFLQLDQPSLEKSIAKIFGSKGEDIVNLNIQAFRTGMALGNQRV